MHYFPSGVLAQSTRSTAVGTWNTGLYECLMDLPGAGDPFDRHVLASAIVRALADDLRPLNIALGMPSAMLLGMLDTSFPAFLEILETTLVLDDDDVLAIEEADLRSLLLAHRTAGSPVEEWLAHIIVRRSLCPDHLWSNLGVRSRKELSATLFRHFTSLAEQNVRDMRWKKFFYRLMCETEGIVICKSPVCDSCPDFSECFSTEE